MSYQAVIWDASGNLVSEKTVSIKISILQGSVTGTSVYSESHRVVTNINGLVSLMIGGGINATGKIAEINWGSGSYFLKTETDPTGGGNYSISGISQLVSVPYSFFSGMTGNIQTTKPGLPGQVLKLDEQGKPFWSGSSYPIVSNQMVSLTSCTASLTVNVSDDGGSPVTSRGVVWSTSPNPTITSSKVIEGDGKGSFSTTLPNLAPNTTYYIRAFATNDVGTGYGSEIKVTTFSGIAIPTVTTIPISDITSTTAKSGGIVTGDCGSVVTARGVVWSTSPNPTISLTTKTTNGSGIGSFTSSLTGLTPNTTYYVKAYATNSAGTGYANEVTFKTSQNCSPNPVLSGSDILCVGSVAPIRSDILGGVWSSNNPSVATINQSTGVVNAVSSGFVELSYMVKGINGCPDVLSKLPITVIPLETKLDVSGDNFLCLGEINELYSSIDLPYITFSIQDPSIIIRECKLTGPTPFRDNQICIKGLKTGKTEILFKYGGFGDCPALTVIKEITVVSCSGSAPSVITNPVSQVTNTTAIGNGTIIYKGTYPIIDSGIVWSTNPNPVISLNTKVSGKSYDKNIIIGVITGLNPNTKYYTRAYAQNSIGLIGYGDDLIFTTTNNVMGKSCPGLPTVRDIDGNTYNTVQIGSQCWIKENLRVTKYNDGSLIPLDQTGGKEGNGSGQTWSQFKIGARTIYENSSLNLNIYGFLYNWYTGIDLRGICPNGWKIPSQVDWDHLGEYLGGQEVAGYKLIETANNYWINPNLSASNESGFTALPGGMRGNYGKFFYKSYNAIFLNHLRRRDFTLLDNGYYSTFTADGGLDPENGFSIRCVKYGPSNDYTPSVSVVNVNVFGSTFFEINVTVHSDGGSSVTSRGVVWSLNPNPTILLNTKTEDGNGIGSFISKVTGLKPGTSYYIRSYATNSNGTVYGPEEYLTTSAILQGNSCTNMPSIKDIDNNTYNTVQIGSQCWMRENLKVTRYNDGSLIPLDASGGNTGISSGETWSTRTTGARTLYGNDINNLTTFGYLYNWYAGTDSRGLCPNGWRVPSNDDWGKLYEFLSPNNSSDIDGKLKAVGTQYWHHPNLGATNETGFSALPGGKRFENGTFNLLKIEGIYLDTDGSTNYANFYHNYPHYRWWESNANKKTGVSVRCIKN
jgi:uncharacterized protein (TIGR02145 family)